MYIKLASSWHVINAPQFCFTRLLLVNGTKESFKLRRAPTTMGSSKQTYSLRVIWIHPPALSGCAGVQALDRLSIERSTSSDMTVKQRRRWGKDTQLPLPKAIVELLAVRKRNGIHCRSKVTSTFSIHNFIERLSMHLLTLE